MGPLLVTGGTGYLGGELLRQAAGRPLAATYLSGTPGRDAGVDWIELDVRDAAAVSALMERLRPEAVVHTAYRQEGEGARETTVDGAARCRGRGGRRRPARPPLERRHLRRHEAGALRRVRPAVSDHRLRPGEGRRRASRRRRPPGGRCSFAPR